MKQLTAEQINEQLKGLADEYKVIDFTEQDFTGYYLNFSEMKAGRTYNDFQKAKKIYNDYQKAKKIYNDSQEANIIYNDFQKAKKIYNDFQKAKKIYNDYQKSSPKSKEMTLEELLKIASEKEGTEVKLKQ